MKTDFSKGEEMDVSDFTQKNIRFAMSTNPEKNRLFVTIVWLYEPFAVYSFCSMIILLFTWFYTFIGGYRHEF